MGQTNRSGAPAEGERNAIGGYHPQYRLAAGTILQSLRHETLEWIRLADPKAGRVDDFQIGTPGSVDGYQVKWARDGGNFTFRDLTVSDSDNPCLIAQLADGWQKLSQTHSHRRAVVHLLTNQTPSVSKLLDRTDGFAKGSFGEFLNQAWNPFHESGTGIPAEWQPVWDSLISASTLSAMEFNEFAGDCKLRFGVTLPGKLENGANPDPIFERDLRQLTEFLQSVVADPSNIVELSRGTLLDRVGWANRLTYVSRHEFPNPTIPYREIEASSNELRVAIQNLISGYLVLLGDPGSGKSTLLTKTLLALPCRVIRYYAFVPDSPDPRRLRGEAWSFLHDITLSLDRAGFRAGHSISEPKDVGQLVHRFHDQLQLLHQNWCDTGCQTVILIDGLDHISRELKPQDSLLKYFPHPDQVPEGVLVVLGSQTDQLTDLPNPVLHSIQRRERRILIERLSRDSVAAIVEQANLPAKLSTMQRSKVEKLVAGHPLALALLVNRLGEGSDEVAVDEILDSTEPFGAQINEIYYGHWRQVIDDNHDDELASLLGKLVRLRPTIDLQWVETWAGTSVVDRLRRSLYHLFRRESRHRWYFFHNSFRLFLLHRTAESPPDGFDENRDRRIHSELANLCAAEPPSSHWNWEEAYHRNCAGEHEEAVALTNASHLRAQLHAFRPIDAIQDDIRMAITSAGVLRDFIGLVRLLFTGAEFASRDDTFSFTSIHDLLLGIGDTDKACINVRDGRSLRLTAESAIDFSFELAAMGHDEEARLVFELAEPIDLLKNPQGERELQHNQVDALISWANAAVSYRPIADVVRLIRGTKQHTFTWDRDADQTQKIIALQNNLLTHAGYGLIDLQKWDDFELVFAELEESDFPGLHQQYWLCVHAWEACYRDGDSPRAEQFVERATSLIELSDLSDEEIVRLSEGILLVVGDKERARGIFAQASQPSLTTDPGTGNRLEPYMQRFRYNRLLYAFGEKREAGELIPDAAESHNQAAVYFERGMSEIARVWAMKWREISLDGPMFVQELRSLLLLFSRNWNAEDGRAHWSLILGLRPNFYRLLVRAAQAHGRRAVEELTSAFEKEWFDGNRSGFWPFDDIRSITRSLHRAGADKEWCLQVLERTESERDDTDSNSRVSWRAGQAESLIQIGEEERAKPLLSQIVRLSAGVGYRKDHQVDTWIEWMRKANQITPESAEQRITFLASALIGMVDSTEGRAATSAAALLLEAAFDWSPIRAVRLCRYLSETDVIAYASGAAIIVRRALESENPPSQLCLSYCANLLIPISTASEGDLLHVLLKRYSEVHGKDTATEAARVLLKAVNIWSLPETRHGWQRGIVEGLRELKIPLGGFEIDSESDTSINDDSSTKLMLADGRQLSREELPSQIESPGDLLSLVESEASGSYFDWSSLIRELAERMNADEVYEFAQALHLRRREAKSLAVLSERLLKLGDKQHAWELAIRAVESVEHGGWSIYNDDGTFRVAYKVLATVDSERGRAMAFDSLVKQLNGEWYYPLSVAQNLEPIASILCETVPVGQIWSIIENYLRALFPEISAIDPTIFELDVAVEDSPHQALTALVCEFLGHPAHLLSEGAIRACFDLLQIGNPHIQNAICRILLDSDQSTTDTLIALDAASKFDVSTIRAFQNQIDSLRRSPDQSIRWSAHRLANRLNLPAAEPLPVTSVTSHYQGRAIIVATKQLYGSPSKSSFDILQDSHDPNELVSPWLKDIEVIAEAANFSVDAVLARVIAVMREISPESTWNAEAEQELRHRLDNAELEFPFRRPRSSQSRRAIFRVLAELADGGRISSELLETFERMFRTYDPDLILFRPAPRPADIPSVSCPQYNEFKNDWIDDIANVDLYPICSNLDDKTVLAEHTTLKPAGNNMPSEERKSILCPQSMEGPSDTMDDQRFFPRVIRELSSTYHESYSEFEEFPAVVHWAYGYDTPGEGWLALNPDLGRKLEWEPSNNGFLAWEKNNQLMAETIWWNDGSLDHSMPFYRKGEVGEGWLVVATEAGFDQIASEIGPLKRIVAVTREIVEDRDRLKRTRYFVDD